MSEDDGDLGRLDDDAPPTGGTGIRGTGIRSSIFADHNLTEDIAVAAERFWAKVIPTGFCWNFTGATGPFGHGTFYLWQINGVPIRPVVHRLAYELLVGPIPDGLVLDHLCHSPSCVNPDHLEPVTQGENARRGRRSLLPRARGERCHRGLHLMSVDGYESPRGRRHCRACYQIARSLRSAA